MDAGGLQWDTRISTPNKIVVLRTYDAIDGENFNKETEIQFKIEINK